MVVRTVAGARSRARGSLRPPAGALVATGAVSVQCGAAVAIHLFSRVGPAGAVTLRLVFAAACLGAMVRPRREQVRRLRHRRQDLAVAVAFGLVLGAMNLSFYEAIARVPLGVAVTVEFVGPLAVTIGGSRRRADVAWAVLATAGVLLLSDKSLLGASHLDGVGIAFALLAGACWAGYILLSKETGRRWRGGSGLGVAMLVAAMVALPFGIAGAGGRLLRPEVLAMGLAVAILSSALPYSLDMAALRRVSSRAFGVLLSLDPAVAALAGLVILGQRLTGLEWVALGLVAAANAGSSWVDARDQ